jgi:dTDP-4-dehydrorhamnose 3,5-epimerase
MPFTFTRLAIPAVILIQPEVLRDDRGFFLETYKQSDFAKCGIGDRFVQCNQSKSAHGTLRGLHYQRNPKAQGKLIRAVGGEIYDVAVDLRRGAPSYGRWVGTWLSAENLETLYVPAGFAHGFCVISEHAEVSYMASEEYAPEYEGGIVWNDPELKIAWPIHSPHLSKSDRNWPGFRDANHNFEYAEAGAETVR